MAVVRMAIVPPEFGNFDSANFCKSARFTEKPSLAPNIESSANHEGSLAERMAAAGLRQKFNRNH
jgi:hypothetical protein